MVACAFGQPKYEWGKLNPRVRKCIMCPDLVKQGRATACAEICPTGATKFGDHDAMVAEAQDRLRKSPDNYVPHIYGLKEVGGTSVLLLSSVPFESFGLPLSAKLGETPMPDYTFRILSKIPDFVPLWALVLGGVYWISHRREEVAQAEAAGHDSRQGGTK
jgi:formate dehydrogenase iron-sulfur subunit